MVTLTHLATQGRIGSDLFMCMFGLWTFHDRPIVKFSWKTRLSSQKWTTGALPCSDNVHL